MKQTIKVLNVIRKHFKKRKPGKNVIIKNVGEASTSPTQKDFSTMVQDYLESPSKLKF